VIAAGYSHLDSVMQSPTRLEVVSLEDDEDDAMFDAAFDDFEECLSPLVQTVAPPIVPQGSVCEDEVDEFEDAEEWGLAHSALLSQDRDAMGNPTHKGRAEEPSEAVNPFLTDERHDAVACSELPRTSTHGGGTSVEQVTAAAQRSEDMVGADSPARQPTAQQKAMPDVSRAQEFVLGIADFEREIGQEGRYLPRLAEYIAQLHLVDLGDLCQVDSTVEESAMVIVADLNKQYCQQRRDTESRQAQREPKASRSEGLWGRLFGTTAPDVPSQMHLSQRLDTDEITL